MDDRLHVATLLLGNIIATDRGAPPVDRIPDIRDCICLADLLIEQCTALAHVPPRGSRGDSGPSPLAAAISERRGRESNRGQPPTLH